jgi:hypothetical protein
MEKSYPNPDLQDEDRLSDTNPTRDAFVKKLRSKIDPKALADYDKKTEDKRKEIEEWRESLLREKALRGTKRVGCRYV